MFSAVNTLTYKFTMFLAPFLEQLTFFVISTLQICFFNFQRTKKIWLEFYNGQFYVESLFPNIPLQGTTHFWVEDLFSLRKKCLYSELFWSVFSHIWTEYAEMLCISLYSVQIRGNTDQNNYEYEHFLCSSRIMIIYKLYLKTVFKID